MAELGPQDFPVWLNVLAVAALLVGVASAIWLTVQVVRTPPHHRVMAIVWPLTGLFAGPLALALYDWRAHRLDRGERLPRFAVIATSTSHCGAGCALGDLIAEWAAFALPAIAVAAGWHWLFEDKMFAVWVVDFVLAFVLGIMFQFAALAGGGRGAGRTLLAAIKADAASITAWQVGMFGTMALIQLLILPAAFGGRASVASPEFWFAMQLAMIAGFAVSFPVNALLLRRGIKEEM